MEYKFQKTMRNATIRPSTFSVLTEYNLKNQIQWMESNWTISLYAVYAYLVFIYFGQKFMKNRKPLHLQNPLILWNFLLATFSFYGCYIMVPALMAEFIGPDGLYKSICNPWDLRTEGEIHWAFLFIVSKVPELVDTVFIVLRKRPLIFLHWYHHISVLLYCWFTYLDLHSTGHWFATMNFVVHSIMYTYYGLRAMKIQIPSRIAMLITTLQILQMIVGLFVVLYATKMNLDGTDCSTNFRSLSLALGMYASYFVLFGIFFYKAYFVKRRKRIAIKNK